jgi:hypothetical protein
MSKKFEGNILVLTQQKIISELRITSTLSEYDENPIVCNLVSSLSDTKILCLKLEKYTDKL